VPQPSSQNPPRSHNYYRRHPVPRSEPTIPRLQSMLPPQLIVATDSAASEVWWASILDCNQQHPAPSSILPPPRSGMMPPSIRIDAAWPRLQARHATVSGCNLGHMPDPSTRTYDSGHAYDCNNSPQLFSALRIILRLRLFERRSTSPIIQACPSTRTSDSPQEH
jgi:hypothetical protein